MSPSFVSQLENGKSQPSVATLYSLAQLLEVSIVQDAAYPQTSSSLRSVSAAYEDAARLRLALHFRRMADHVR